MLPKSGVRKGMYHLRRVFGHDISTQRLVLDGEDVRLFGSGRLRLFKLKGFRCVTCGITGRYVALGKGSERDRNYHINLYARTEDGEEVLMTKDHIIPISKGGGNGLDNLQTMCSRCNAKKADHVDGGGKGERE